jgi:glycosyltransferase involved in cell wall biosynthesis
LRQIIIHAPNVHTGGGLTLLKALITAWPASMQFVAVLDARCQHLLELPLTASVVWTSASVRSRVASEFALFRLVRDSSNVVLCFNGLPPLLRCRCDVKCFVQNILLVTKTSLNFYPLRVRIRLSLERWFFKKFSANVSTFLVQSQSMLIELQKTLPRHTSCRVMPFAPIPSKEAICSSIGRATFEFVYVASGEPHKNHLVLLDAWEQLAKEGIFPSLALTVDESYYPQIKERLAVFTNAYGMHVTNLGAIDAATMPDLYRASKALIYPSLYESFGLPLLEAKQHGLAVLAAERDYVRDVLDPIESFDPRSAQSIRSCVKRYLRISEPKADVFPAGTFLAEIIK